MRAVVCAVDHPYYLWQVLVQIQHFKERGELSEVDWLLYHQGPRPSAQAQKIALSTGARLHFWQDRRKSKHYNPSMRPWLMGSFLRQYPNRVEEPLQYLDPDVMLLQPAEYYDEIPAWSASPTEGYTGPSYLRKHGEDLWQDLCGIAGVRPADAEAVPGVGAQWVVQDAGPEFWFEVAVASDEMFRRCERQPKPEGSEFKVQSWCAEMYATQLVALAYGFPVRSEPRMSFVWAGGNLDEFSAHGYFHDAGVPQPNGRDFCKTEYQSSPFVGSIEVSPDSASLPYVELIRRTRQAYPSVVW